MSKDKIEAFKQILKEHNIDVNYCYHCDCPFTEGFDCKGCDKSFCWDCCTICECSLCGNTDYCGTTHECSFEFCISCNDDVCPSCIDEYHTLNGNGEYECECD